MIGDWCNMRGECVEMLVGSGGLWALELRFGGFLGWCGACVDVQLVLSRPVGG